MNSKKHWWREFNCVKQAPEKSIWWFLEVSDGGRNKVITTANHHYFCSSYNFFCNCKYLPKKYWVFTQNHFTFFISHSDTMKRSFFLCFYKITHDPLSGHLKKEAALEPGGMDTAVRCDRILEWQLNWQRSWLF